MRCTASSTWMAHTMVPEAVRRARLHHNEVAAAALVLCLVPQGRCFRWLWTRVTTQAMGGGDDAGAVGAG